MNEGVVFRWFRRFLSDPIPHYTTLQKAITHIGHQTWFRINEVLVAYSKIEKSENGHMLRIDTTVTETNIAYSLDSRLLNDSVRILARLMVQIKEQIPELAFSFADRTRRAKNYVCHKNA